MQAFVFVLFQIDEACRYLLDRRLEQLRLALLLLDNAATEYASKFKSDTGVMVATSCF